jgi:hypothetical protein
MSLFGKFHQQIDDDDIFHMLLGHKLYDVICPYCEHKGDYPPTSEFLNCTGCNQEFKNPLDDPAIVYNHENEKNGKS